MRPARTPFLPSLLLLTASLAGAGQDPAAPPERPDGPPGRGAPDAPAEARPRGLVLDGAGASTGFTLLAPLRSTTTYLVDEKGREVHRWEAELPPGQTAELLPNGHLLRAARSGDNERFGGGGEGGRLQEFDWEGNLVWNLDLSSDERLAHHDFEVLPNGNVLVIVWEHVDAATAEARGRYPGSVAESGLWPDALLELQPLPPDRAEVVWEWHAFDHLVQDVDPELPHHGSIAAHPERIDVNRGAPASLRPETEEERAARLALERQLAAIGYSGDDPDEDDAPGGDGGRDRGAGRRGSDWMHTNSVDLDPELDLIVISLREWSEIWVLDHSTTSEEAAGSSGGRHGRGGDILWRWGNPANHGQGGADDRRLFGQHDARWTRDGERVAISVFNNGEGREGAYSSVDLIPVPLVDGTFASPADGRLARVEASWSYVAPEPTSFYSGHISGAQPLGDGRFLVCQGEAGRVFEVDREGTVHWDLLSPFEGTLGPGGPGGPGGSRGRGPDGAGRPPGGGPPDGFPPRGGDGPPDGAGPPDGGRRAPGGRGPEGRGPGGRGPGGPGGRGPGGMSAASLFRAQRIPRDHPGVRALVASDAVPAAGDGR